MKEATVHGKQKMLERSLLSTKITRRADIRPAPLPYTLTRGTNMKLDQQRSK
jgi:hypothetical protein